MTLLPWLARRPYAILDPELRKAFEVALHAGTAAALLIALRGEVGDAIRGLDRAPRRAARRLVRPARGGRPTPRAADRAAPRHAGDDRRGPRPGALAMLAADRAPPSAHREDAGSADALALGLAQACALVPGVSRNGATLTAARRRPLHARPDANALSRHVALPVIAGATLLKGARLRRRGLPPGAAGPFALGAAAASPPPSASAWLIRLVERDRPLWPYAVYRLALAARRPPPRQDRGCA